MKILSFLTVCDVGREAIYSILMYNIFSYPGPSGILGSDGNQKTA